MARPGEGPNSGSVTGLKSLGKAVRVLQAFSLQEPRLPLTEIAKRTGLPPSTAHRILTTLREAGLVDQEGDRDVYRLGLKLLELGSMVLANMDVHREALPFIEELVRETGETVHLGIFDGTHVVSIEKMESPHALASHVTIGKGAPAYCTGVGKALLAFQPEAVVEAVCRSGFVRYTSHTIVGPARLRKELARVRAQGYAVDNAEHQPDVRCVAAPVRDHSGRVIASLSVSGPATRLPRDRVPALAARMRAVAAQLSTRLGYRGR
jgi:DNA-binding IclR family transcriptional regulator